MLSILLVDDEPSIRLAIGDALIRAGHRVARAKDGVQASDLCAAQVFDLVITDVGRGEVPGAGAEIIWRRHRWTGVVSDLARPIALIRLDSLLALVAFDFDPTDSEIVATLSDIESRLLAASQGD